jgi:RNA polymerase sigma factor for flagellar operon FliA
MLVAPDLMRQGLPVVQAVARRLARRLGSQVLLDDLVGIGNLALLTIARTWDPSRGTFVAHATWRLKCAILDGLRRETHGRIVTARAAALIASERLADARAGMPDPEGPTTFEDDQAALSDLLASHAAALALGLVSVPRADLVQQAELAEVVRSAVLTLPVRERALMERHYYGGEQFDAIAEDLGISKSWASRLHERAVQRVRYTVDPPGPADPT